MKQCIHFIASLVMLLASGTLFAQNDGEAVKKLVQDLRSHKSIEVSFSYQTVNGAPQSDAAPEVKEGTAYIQGKAYKFIMDDQQALCDGKTKWHYIVEDEEVMVGNATDDDNPYKILDNIERDDSGLNANIDKKGELKGFEVALDDDVTLILTIKTLKYDQDYPSGFFSFDAKAYPNVEIIDMR